MTNTFQHAASLSPQASSIEMLLPTHEAPPSIGSSRLTEATVSTSLDTPRLSPNTPADGARSPASSDKAKHCRFLSDLAYAGFGQTAVLATVLAVSNARTLLKAEYGITPLEEGLIAASLPLGMAVGQNVFGDYAVQLGAKKMGQIAACISGAGALFSSIQHFSVPTMIGLSLLTGFGLGGETPVTNEMCKEYVNNDHVTKVLPLANNLGGIGEVLALVVIAATADLPDDQAWRAQLSLGAALGLINYAARSALPSLESQKSNVEEEHESESPIELAEQGNGEGQVPTPAEHSALLPSYQHATPNSTSADAHENLLNSRWTPLVLSAASVCFLHEMVNNTITTYSPEFLDRGALFSVYSLACLANFASPYTLAFPKPDSSGCSRLAIGRHAALAKGLLVNASIYSAISLGKGSIWQENGQGENRTLSFSTPLAKSTFTALFTLQQMVLAGYTAASMYAFPSEAVPRHQSCEALGKVASMGKIGAILGALVMPVLREKYGFESVVASCAASLFMASAISQFGLPVYDEEQAVRVQHNANGLFELLYHKSDSPA